MDCSHCTFRNPLNSTECDICHANLERLNTNVSSASLEPTPDLQKIDREKIIEKNYLDAYRTIPESFFEIHMLYFNCSINGVLLKAFVDTGAQMSIMSKKTAIKCNVDYLIDHKFKGIAKGVGTQKIIGKIHLLDLEIDSKGTSLPCSFRILEDQDLDIIFGLDMLMSHGIMLDLKNKNMTLGNIIIKFVKVQNRT